MGQTCQHQMNLDQARKLLGGGDIGGNPESESASKPVRSTRSRWLVLEAAFRAPAPFNCEDILAILNQTSIQEPPPDRATVYRNIQLFVERGILVRTDVGAEAAHFEPASLHTEHHHHYIVCRTCKERLLLDECGLQSALDALTQQGFRKITHRIEIEAICPACAADH